MIDALVHGRLISCREDGTLLVGRIVMDGDVPVQFSAKRGSLKRAIAAMPQGMPVSVSGRLSTSVKYDKEGRPFVLHDLFVSAVLTAQPKSLLGSIL